MTLSIKKLEEMLIVKKQLLPRRFFTVKNICYFIEVMSLATSDIFLVYIPSKYEFIMKHGQNVLKMTAIEMAPEETREDELAGGRGNIDPEETYGGVDIILSHEEVQNQLENHYKREITISDISKSDSVVIRSLYRQMERLRFCVQNINYKIGVIFKNYFCVIRRDDSVTTYIIKNHAIRNGKKSLYIVADLETIYEKDKIVEDVRVVRESIYNLLERNQGVHTQVLEKMLTDKKDVMLVPKCAQEKKMQYSLLLENYEKMLEVMHASERKVMGEIDLLEKNPDKTLQDDINKAHERTKLIQDLEKIRELKGEIINNIISVREKCDNSVLSIDDIMFNNTVIFDVMIKNFAKLKEFC